MGLEDEDFGTIAELAQLLNAALKLAQLGFGLFQ